MNLDRLIRYALKMHRKLGTPQNRRFRRHFSFLLDRNDIMAIGISKDRKTHPIAASYGYVRSIHSEVDCFLKLDKEEDAVDKIMFNVRIHRDGIIGMSRPCPQLCQPFLTAIGVRSVLFTNQDAEIELWEP